MLAKLIDEHYWAEFTDVTREAFAKARPNVPGLINKMTQEDICDTFSGVLYYHEVSGGISYVCQDFCEYMSPVVLNQGFSGIHQSFLTLAYDDLHLLVDTLSDAMATQLNEEYNLVVDYLKNVKDLQEFLDFMALYTSFYLEAYICDS